MQIKYGKGPKFINNRHLDGAEFEIIFIYGAQKFGPKWFTPFIRAKITIYLSYLNDFCSIGWTQIIPEPIIEISKRSEKYNRESMKESIKIADDLPSEGMESRTD